MKIKDRRSAAAQLLKKAPGPLTLCDLTVMSKIPPGMTRAYRNNRYTVMIFDNTMTTKGEAIMVLIQRVDDRPIVGHWREIQNIKNELFVEETIGIEYYPAESNLLDTHNIYWLWIFPPDVLPRYIIR
jgi:hypothetical protein